MDTPVPCLFADLQTHTHSHLLTLVCASTLIKHRVGSRTTGVEWSITTWKGSWLMETRQHRHWTRSMMRWPRLKDLKTYKHLWTSKLELAVMMEEQLVRGYLLVDTGRASIACNAAFAASRLFAQSTQHCYAGLPLLRCSAACTYCKLSLSVQLQHEAERAAHNDPCCFPFFTHKPPLSTQSTCHTT